MSEINYDNDIIVELYKVFDFYHIPQEIIEIIIYQHKGLCSKVAFELKTIFNLPRRKYNNMFIKKDIYKHFVKNNFEEDFENGLLQFVCESSDKSFTYKSIQRKLDIIDSQLRMKDLNINGWWYRKQDELSAFADRNILQVREGSGGANRTTLNWLLLMEFRWRLAIHYHISEYRSGDSYLPPNIKRLETLMENIGIENKVHNIDEYDSDDDDKYDYDFLKPTIKNQKFYLQNLTNIWKVVAKTGDCIDSTEEICRCCGGLFPMMFITRKVVREFPQINYYNINSNEENFTCLYCDFTSKHIDWDEDDDDWDKQDGHFVKVFSV